jgi:hypothetical protein
MTHPMKILIVVIAMAMVWPVSGQRRSKEDTGEGPVFREGVIYALPQTGIRMYVDASKTHFTPGPYARFAHQLLGIPYAKTEASSEWTMEGVFLETFSEPDPEQVFKARGEVAALVGLTPEGCLAGINIPAPESLEKERITNTVFYPHKEKEFQFDNLSDLPFFSAGDSTNGFRSARLSLEQKAMQAAERILDCRRMKYETAIGYLDVLPPDGKAYEASLKQLDRIEREYLSLFTGRSITTTYRFSFEYIPTVNTKKGEVVFRFSEEKGILEKSDLTGKPVLLEVMKISTLTDRYERLRNSDNPDAGLSGVFYRQPGMAEVRLIYELKTLVSSRIPVSQFGVTAPVPEMFLDGHCILEFHPSTGAIKNITCKEREQ